jgi:hypothetical protein
MNITLSADKKLIEKTRAFAKKHNTTLNNLVREYLQQLTNEDDKEQLANEFANLAKNQSGKSAQAFKFNRDEIYSRGV